MSDLLAELDQLPKLYNETTPSAPSPQKYIYAATSDNTRKAYQSDIRHFIDWGGLLPATVERIVTYLYQHADQLNPRTLERRLTAIKQWHLLQGFFDPTSNPLVRKTLIGIKNVHDKPTDKASALTLESLIKIVNFLKSSRRLMDIRNAALIQVGFFGAFKCSELVAIKWEHITFSQKGVEILIPKSKTDQSDEGQVCVIPYGDKNLCPVKALEIWQDYCGLSSGFVFRRLSKSENILENGIKSNQLNVIIKQLAELAKLPKAESYSSHSLRRGFATEAARKGASFSSIMRQGRWHHEGTVLGYMDEGKRFDQNAASAIFEK